MTDLEYASIRANVRRLQEARNKAIQEKTAALKKLEEARKSAAVTRQTFMPAPNPKEIADFNYISGRHLISVRPKQPVQGGGGLRSRWVDEENRIWEWDYLHGEFEVFDASGKRHLGAWSMLNQVLKGGVKGRTTAPL